LSALKDCAKRSSRAHTVWSRQHRSAKPERWHQATSVATTSKIARGELHWANFDALLPNSQEDLRTLKARTKQAKAPEVRCFARTAGRIIAASAVPYAASATKDMEHR